MAENKVEAVQTAEDENHIIGERRAKLLKWREEGHAYPNDFVRKDLFGDLRAAYGEMDAEALEAKAVDVTVAGRMMLKRIMGKASFATVRDVSGTMQYFLSAAEMGDEAYQMFKGLDIGDIIGAEGVLFKTKRGELSIRVRKLRLLSKAIRPLAEKFKGLSDQELCYRQRYLDLIMNEDSRARFLKRSQIVAEIRRYMIDNRFMEVETPMLHPIPGGANAKPFITHHNALDMDMYLRIAPELYLKRLVVGGFERVFELNRNFRNEGVDVRHNPEFTMMEFYATYWTYKDQMDFTEALLRHVAETVTGSAVVNYQGMEIDLSKPFARMTPREAILKNAPQYTVEQLDDDTFLRNVQPTFVIDYPVEISPLARASDADPSITERFELYIAGRETANGFSELNDPEDQAARFKAQADAKAHGDDEAMYYDSDYIRALEFGLPPTGGCGIGIDRFVMLLTDAPSIRDVLLFPHMRPEA